MKTRVLIQQDQIVKPGQQLWVIYAGCSNCCDATWDLHVHHVPFIVAFYWRGVCFFRGQWMWESVLSIWECWRRWSLTSAWAGQWLYTSCNNWRFSPTAVQWSSCWMARGAGWHLQRWRGSEAKWPLCSENSTTAFHICTKIVGVVAIFQFYV